MHAATALPSVTPHIQVRIALKRGMDIASRRLPGAKEPETSRNSVEGNSFACDEIQGNVGASVSTYLSGHKMRFHARRDRVVQQSRLCRGRGGLEQATGRERGYGWLGFTGKGSAAIKVV